MNLPDLSLTPRFQAKDKYERENARACSAYFNRRLMAACAGLQKQYPDCTIEAVDVNREFAEMFNHPEKYQMDKSKLSQPYTKSGDFRILKNGTSPATGYMFWDDVHPTADVHAMLAYIFCERYRNRFHFMDPAVAQQKRKSQMGRQVRVLERTHSCDRLRLNQFGVLCHTHRNDRQHAPSSHELRRQSAQSRIQPSDCHDETVDNPANKSRC
ncbi:hypothetical protein AQUSIP_08940 [Aquicella siphonis]|uniref:Thermolabile hemolysin n=1 Tax=Aquicella siphonis TaxID=254247 RepID=A0A5E4PFI4_9COXI|nr:SGNH/GDSL hydrolase family protein [Aquicella siphonis]VVC75604.1 hypothetical protein AQUSIP_08940 [Aquicella siphonis]